MTGIFKVEDHISYREKRYEDFKNLERSNQEVLIEKAVKTTIQIIYDKKLLDKQENAIEVINDYLLTDVNEKRRPDLDPIRVQSTTWVFQTQNTMMLFNYIIQKECLMNKATSDVKIHHIVCSLALNDVMIKLGNGPFTSDVESLTCTQQKKHVG